MTEKQKIYGVYAFCTIFILLIIYCIIKEIYWVPVLIPVLIGAVCLYFFALDKVLLLITFFTPVSMSLSNTDFGLSVSLPDEPMLLVFVFMLLFKLFYDGKINKELWRHPVTIIILISFVWYFITCISSELPLVSFKHLAARIWFVVPCYFVGARVFKKQSNIKKYNWAYILSFCVVIVYSLIVHSRTGFSQHSSVMLGYPFFPEHTCYGAMLAFMLPAIVMFCLDKEYSPWIRFCALGILALFIAGLIFSYTRAAWLSALAAFALFVAFKLKIKFKHIFLVGAILFALFFAFREQIIIKLERNSQDSSQNFIEHVKSITNISSDASNLERINRWQSALRMFEERPVLGWGPGTYQFIYAPFQRSRDKTIISTNAGNLGNAHSEYLGPLAEQGLPGLLITIILFISIIATANRVYWKSPHKFDRNVSLCCMLALITYFIHGALNNFLDIDKAAVPFWLYVAIIVSLDIKNRDEYRKLQQNSQKPAEDSETGGSVEVPTDKQNSTTL